MKIEKPKTKDKKREAKEGKERQKKIQYMKRSDRKQSREGNKERARVSENASRVVQIYSFHGTDSGHIE